MLHYILTKLPDISSAMAASASQTDTLTHSLRNWLRARTHTLRALAHSGSVQIRYFRQLSREVDLVNVDGDLSVGNMS